MADRRPLRSLGHDDQRTWRLVFRFKDGDAVDVEIVDYH
jgi:plasmid maintenance system killer protein